MCFHKWINGKSEWIDNRLYMIYVCEKCGKKKTIDVAKMKTWGL